MEEEPNSAAGSPRRGRDVAARRVAYLVCLVGLPLYLWGMQGERRIGAFPATLAAHELHYPVRIEGQTAESPEHLASLVERYRPGRSVRLEVEGSPGWIQVGAAYSPFHALVSAVSALFFWLVCLLVFARRADRDPGRVFFLATFSYGLAISVGTVAFPGDPRGVDALRPVLRSGCVALLPVFFVRMALLFPHRRPAVDERPWILPALFAIALALAGWRSATLLRYFVTPTPELWRASVGAGQVLDVFLMALVGSGCLLMYQAGRQAELARERHQLKWLWWGITVGITPYVFLYTLPRMLAGGEFMPLHVARLFAMAVPTAMAFAAVKYKLLDIDVIIRRSLIYAVLAGVLATVYWFLAEKVFAWLAPLVQGSAEQASIGAAVAAVILYGPTRRVVGRSIDRTFFHIRYSYGQALRRFRQAIVKPRDERELARFIRRFVVRLLAPKTGMVFVRAGREWVGTGGGNDALVAHALRAVERSVEPRDRVRAAPGTTSTPEVESPEYPKALRREGIVLVQPLVASGVTHGFLVLGERRSERRYVEEDLALLAGIAAASAAVLERFELAQRVAEERIVRERLDAINRMKSEFLSRVAHDLRTPVTSIDWSARNLLDGLAGPVQASQAGYLQAILASAIQLQRLVTDLVELGRLEDGGPSFELGAVGLAAAATEAMTTLEPIAASRDVRFAPRMEPGLGPVLGNRERLVQVLVNLLDNAARYSPPGSEVTITLQRAGVGSQRLSVRDVGPGIRPGDEERIFDRYHQGPPSPHTQAQGFGLGLYVVRSHVEAFTGQVRAVNHPQGGAEFTLVLPEWAGAPTASP